MLVMQLAADLPDAVTQPFEQLLGWMFWLICLAGVGVIMYAPR